MGSAVELPCGSSSIDDPKVNRFIVFWWHQARYFGRVWSCSVSYSMCVFCLTKFQIPLTAARIILFRKNTKYYIQLFANLFSCDSSLCILWLGLSHLYLSEYYYNKISWRCHILSSRERYRHDESGWVLRLNSNVPSWSDTTMWRRINISAHPRTTSKTKIPNRDPCDDQNVNVNHPRSATRYHLTWWATSRTFTNTRRAFKV